MRGLYFVIAAAFSGVATSDVALAQQRQYSCPAPQADYRMPDCPIVLLEKAEQEMRTAFNLALQKARRIDEKWEPVEMRKFESNLRASQAAWEEFSRAECLRTVFAEFPGGSGYSPGLAHCAAKMAEERTHVLKRS